MIGNGRCLQRENSLRFSDKIVAADFPSSGFPLMSVNCFLEHFITHFYPFGCEQNGTIWTKQTDHTAC